MLRYNRFWGRIISPAWIIASCCGPAWEHNPTTVYSISPKPRPISWKNANLGRSPPTKPPLSPLSAIIHYLEWHQQIANVCTMVFTTCHISDNFPRNKLSSFYLPHQSAGPQLAVDNFLPGASYTVPIWCTHIEWKWPPLKNKKISIMSPENCLLGSDVENFRRCFISFLNAPLFKTGVPRSSWASKPIILFQAPLAVHHGSQPTTTAR